MKKRTSRDVNDNGEIAKDSIDSDSEGFLERKKKRKKKHKILKALLNQVEEEQLELNIGDELVGDKSVNSDNYIIKMKQAKIAKKVATRKEAKKRREAEREIEASIGPGLQIPSGIFYTPPEGRQKLNEVFNTKYELWKSKQKGSR